MMTKIVNILLPLGVFCLLPAASQADTFNDIVNRAVTGSPTLQASEARMKAELEGLKADNTLPDPEVEFERLWRSGEGENRWSAGLSQEIGWPGAYSARGEAAQSLNHAQNALMEKEIINERLRASQLIVEIIAANKEIGVLSEINASMQRLREQYLRAWEHGETTILDVNKIKIEAVRAATALEAARNRLRSSTAELQSMSSSGTTAPAVPADLDFPHETLAGIDNYLTALESSPELESLRRMADAAHSSVAVAKSTRYPGVSLGYRHAYEDGSHFNGFSIGLSLPVWSRKHTAESAVATELAARLDLTARSVALETQLRADHANASSLREQMQELGPVVDGVNNLTLLRKALDGGELSLLSYLQEVNYFLQARLDYLSLNKEYTLIALKLNSLLASADDTAF